MAVATDGSGARRGAGRAANVRLLPDRRAYSPITDQRKPIMMKNPTNRAIRPSPP